VVWSQNRWCCVVWMTAVLPRTWDAGSELADGDGGAGDKEHLGRGAEAIIAAFGKSVADFTGVFCGKAVLSPTSPITGPTSRLSLTY
jgi:hypothetical protein